ncbi:MAG: imidazolonepropionase, partial [Solirubrobacterales bacterium]|nr:imidazolonepropionase [Solirubrobacterales bacterium]
MSALVIDNISELVTNDPELGEGPLGLVRAVALVIEGERVAAIEPAGAAGDEHLDAGGRCVVPGFVDSHTHLVFAGDRAEEFAARMAGAPYGTGGIRVTTEATRAAGADELEGLARARREEALHAGITQLEIKSGYGLDIETERRLCEVAARLTDEVTFLGAHAVPPGIAADEYAAQVADEMIPAVAAERLADFVDVFADVGFFDPDATERIGVAAVAAGLGLRVHGNQLGPGPGVGLAVELGADFVALSFVRSAADIDELRLRLDELGSPALTVAKIEKIEA